MGTRKYGEQEFENLRRWLEENSDSQSERLVRELEERISQDYPAKRVMATNSGMAALHLALKTIGVGPGDEVIVDPIVIFGGAAAMYHNAVPVFADIDPRAFNVDPACIEAKITDRTRAIICTHLFGNVCEMERILEIAAAHGIPVVEDCAHTLLTPRNGRYSGLFGDFGAFSFNHRKQLSTGQGGFLTINSDELAERSRNRGFGRVPDRLNWNYHMPGVIAALALAQWQYAEDYVRNDHRLAELYSEALDDCSWIIPQHIYEGNWCAYHIWAAEYRGDEFGVDYERFMQVLRDNGGDYFLPSFMPYGAFGLSPSPAYRYPLFSEPRAYTKGCPTRCPHYTGRVDYDEGACPRAEHLVPRLLNTTVSPIEDGRIARYADALHRTVRHFDSRG